ncbi:hypothetical protein BKA64DRAFT_356453 [Cadophora sp. MPI-SDFR-AT-0126]|nr:hypothetical protein BKA64DRAFT_356453 [Leotiomycetes sp. MPI-SDFR-AT-0126]
MQILTETYISALICIVFPRLCLTSSEVVPGGGYETTHFQIILSWEVTQKILTARLSLLGPPLIFFSLHFAMHDSLLPVVLVSQVERLPARA